MAQNFEYDIIENELIVQNELWKSQQNMVYSILDMPLYLHFALLDEDFISAGTLNDNELTVPLKIGNKDLRIKNITWFDEVHSSFSSETELTVNNDGVLFKDLSVDSTHKVTIGSGVLYTNKTEYDINFGTPVTPVQGIISIFCVNTVYGCYILKNITGTNSIWEELKLPTQTEFWLESDWINGTGKIYDFSNTYSFDSTKSSQIFQKIYREDKTTPVNVQWSIYSYDVDSNNQLRNFLIGEDGSQPFRNKYTNDEPITMCIGVPVDDILTEDTTSTDECKYKVSSTKNCYILFDYTSTPEHVYPLYSPELLETYGIAFVRSDWLFYDESGNLRVAFNPEKVSNLLYDELGHPVTNMPNVSVIGCVKSWKTLENVAETSIGNRNEDRYEYLLGMTNSTINLMLKNRAFAGQSYKMFSSSLLTDQTLPDAISITNTPIHIDYDSNNKPQTVCKADWSSYYALFNGGTVVEKKQNQIAFRFTKCSYGTNKADEIKNLGIWIYNENYGHNQLYYFDTSNGSVTFEKEATYIPSVDTKYSYHKVLSKAKSNLVPYVDEDGNEILQYERWKYVIQSLYTDENIIEFNRINSNVGVKRNYVGYNKIYTKIEKYSPADEDAEELLDSMTKEAGWQTPNDFYSKNVNTSLVDTGSLGYVRASSTVDPIKNNWFWIDEIKNWGIWLRTSDTFLNLYVWNGRNGWDKLEDIMSIWMKNDLQTLKRVYFYNPDVFTLGPSNVSFSTYCSREKNKSPAWMSENVWLSIVLKRDTNMSTYDTDSFQNIHTASILYNGQQGVVIPGNKTWKTQEPIGELKKEYGSIMLPTVGCPCIIRNTNGQLNLMYKFKIDGNYDMGDNNTTDIYFQDEGITYLNSVCKVYFGTGDDKTINNWKRFNLSDNSEEQVDRLYTGTEESLYGVPPVVSSQADTINMKMSMTAPRPNISTKSLANDDYILRWNR